MAIYECITSEEFTELFSTALSSATSFPSTPATTMKRNASAATISVLTSNEDVKKIQKTTTTEPTATEVLGVFFSIHAREYPNVAKIISDKAIQSMILFVMSKPGSSLSKPVPIESVNNQTNQGYRISLDRIESQTNGILITFILYVKTNFGENRTQENPGKHLDFSFYCNMDNEWDWNMGMTKEAFSSQYGGSSNTQYESIQQDPNLKLLTDEGILHTFDVGLSVLSGTIVFHNNTHSCLNFFLLKWLLYQRRTSFLEIFDIR
jgi:hypothetical protein